MKKQNKINMKTVNNLLIDEENENRRVDNFLISQLPNIPKSRIYKMLRKGEVRVNSKRIKSSFKLSINDKVRIPPLYSEEEITKEDVTLKIDNNSLEYIEKIYEDDSLLVVNKPSGIPVHSGSGIKLGLIETLRLQTGNHNLELVHRLDRETSGCLLIAKKKSYLRKLHSMLREGEIKKRYIALVSGLWPKSLNKIDAPLLRIISRAGDRKVIVDERGKESVTNFQVIKRCGSAATLIYAFPITGRTHQIRVHAHYAGYPLLVDDKYGNWEINANFKAKGLSRLFLHASQINYKDPDTEEIKNFVAQLPTELEELIAGIK